LDTGKSKLSDVAIISSWQFGAVLQPLPAFAITVVGLNVIFWSVPDCWDVTVAVIVNGPSMNVVMGRLVAAPVIPVSSLETVTAPGPYVIVLAPSVEQLGVQNTTDNACAEKGAIKPVINSSKAILALRMFILLSLVLT